MTIVVTVLDGPLPTAPPCLAAAGSGAVLSFLGVVRPEEEGRAIAGLDYEVYEPMARRMLEQMAHAVGEKHGLLAVSVEHSRGFVPAGQAAFRLQIAARHRGEALAALAEFIDEMKSVAPIWKAAVESPVASAEPGP